jgi:hypothetical protein
MLFPFVFGVRIIMIDSGYFLGMMRGRYFRTRGCFRLEEAGFPFQRHSNLHVHHCAFYISRLLLL